MKRHIFFSLIVAASLLLPGKVNSQSQAATDSALQDVITDNVKKRISEVAQQRSVLSATNTTAFIGTVQKLTNYTLSIQTDDGVKLASTSAESIFTKVPGYQSISLTDLPIDGYLAAIGTVSNGDVLTATHIVYQEKNPAPSVQKVYFGTVQSYDTDDYLLSLQNPQDSDPHLFMISRRASLNRWVTDGTKDEIARTKPIEAYTPVLVVYMEGGGTNGEDLALDVLINPNP